MNSQPFRESFEEICSLADARVVLLGEASHGTSDYYRWRAELTRRLIAERGFSFVAVEGTGRAATQSAAG